MLRIENICKKYGEHTALDAVSMEVPKGSIFGLLGPNGAGKTSLIRIINQIVLPDAGEVWFDGELLQPKHTAQIGYLPEERGLYKSMKVGEQALYLAQLKGLSKEEAKKQLKFKGEAVELSTREFAIIECLLFHKNSFVGIERLRAEVWNDKEIDPADVRMHILKIRQKTTPEFIKSSRGLGYKIDVSKS